MEDIFVLTYILSSILFVSILLIRSIKYFVKKRVSGEVLLKIRPYGLKNLEAASYILLWIVAVLLAARVFRQFEPETPFYMLVKTRLIMFSWIIIPIVFAFFPTKVCENGIIDSYGYVSWRFVNNYTRKSDTYVVMELDKLHSFSVKLKLRHPAEYKDSIDAILSERIKAEQP